MKRLFVLALLCAALPGFSGESERVRLTLDTSEAEAVLAILGKRSASQEVADADWRSLFDSEPYIRLKRREAAMRRDFTDDEFKTFVLSDDVARRAPALRRTLEAWKKADLRATAQRILAYLPQDAQVRAKVYPMIKPKPNSFVFEAAVDPAIFLYLDPEQSQSDFENTVAHESHHIGYSGASSRYDDRIKGLPDDARKAAQWIGAFGEGLAVLAATGSADVHPLRDFKAAERVRWDQDMEYFDQVLAQVDQFFRDVLSGGFAKPEVADHVALTFYGYRGPWYVVGYKMGAVVEKRFGRGVLVDCMSDPRELLAKYNEAAAEQNAAGQPRLPLWSAEVLKAVGL